ncbi:hypothetical protein DRQ26_02150 [bacterium]|nr:MAG: hypothetical protein DRQ26_02150 [bacterium]
MKKFAGLIILSSILLADVPHLISYQGRLTDGTGAPLVGTHWTKILMLHSIIKFRQRFSARKMIKCSLSILLTNQENDIIQYKL